MDIKQAKNLEKNRAQKLEKRSGIEIGEAKGKKEEKLAVAKKMKIKGLTTEEIMEYTELTKEEIEKL